MRDDDLFIGIDLGGHGIRGVLVDGGGREHDALERPLESRGVEEVERALGFVMERLERTASVRDGAVRAVGFGVPGFHRRTDGVLAASPNFPGWEGLPLRRRLGRLAGRPVAVDNDANCAVLGEAWRGAARGLRHVVLLTLGTGIGAGILVDGALLRGATGAGGEAGHLAVRMGGRRCGCGARGCLEAHASGPALAHLAGTDTARQAAAAARDGDRRARRAVSRVGRDLGRALGDLANLFNPEALLVTGGVTRSWDLLAGPCSRGLRERATGEALRVAGDVRVGELGSAAGAVGAARLARDAWRPSAR